MSRLDPSSLSSSMYVLWPAREEGVCSSKAGYYLPQELVSKLESRLVARATWLTFAAPIICR